MDTGIPMLFAWMFVSLIPFGATWWFLSAFIKKQIYILIGSIIGAFIFFYAPFLVPHPYTSFVYLWGCIILGIILRLIPKLKGRDSKESSRS